MKRILIGLIALPVLDVDGIGRELSLVELSHTGRLDAGNPDLHL